MNPNKIQGLNTLRFFAFLSVFLFHATTSFKFGYLGVDFFFVLSSFLLTQLALTEIENTGSFSRKNFFIRRALRIYPLYYLVIVLCFIAIPIVSKVLGLYAPIPNTKWHFFVFMGNYVTGDYIFSLKLLWSIAVEEQFYILFLLLSFFFTKNIFVPIISLLLIYFVYMSLDGSYVLDTYSNLFSHFVNFSSGMLLAFFYKKGKIPSAKNAVLVIIVLSALLAYFKFPEMLFKIIIAIYFGAIISAVVQTMKNSKIAKSFFFVSTEYLGTLTYGLYVLSGFSIPIVSKLLLSKNVNHFAIVVAELLVTICLAWLSYTFYESKFLLLKKKFR